MSIRIFIDTTEFHNQHAFQRPDWERLRVYAEMGQVDAATSDVTVREIVRQWDAKARKSATTFQQAARGASSYFEDIEEPSELTARVPALRTAFESTYREGLGSIGVQICSLPNVGPEEILDRDLAVRPPFEASGKGYRDTLIWLTYLEWLVGATDDTTLAIFVSNNTRDFGGASNGLAPELAEDLRERNLPSTRLAESLSDALDMVKAEVDRLDLQRFDELTAAFADPPNDTVAEDAALTALDDLIGTDLVRYDDHSPRIGFTIESDSLPAGLEGMSIEAFSVEQNAATAYHVDSFGPTTSYWSVEIVGEMTVEGNLPKADLAIASGISIYDADLNKHYAWVGVTIPIKATLSVRIEGGAADYVELEALVDPTEDANPHAFI